MLKFAFFGSDSIAIPVLDELENAGFLPSVVVCSKDMPKGRGLVITPPPAKLWAVERNIPVIQPKKLDEDFISQLKAFNLQLGVIASYGKIIPENILNLFPKGLVNVHPSLLPKLRGPSPLESTILYENEAGVTIIKLDSRMDHGPIIAKEKVNIEVWPPKYSYLEKTLGRAGGKLLVSVLEDYINEQLVPEEQVHADASFTKKFTKEDGLIDLSENSEKNLRKIRAFEEWPGTYFFTEKNGKKIRVKITEAHINDGELQIDRVIPEGKKEMDFTSFSRT